MRAIKLMVIMLLISGSMTACVTARIPADRQTITDGKQKLNDTLQGLHLDKYLVTPQFHPDYTRYGGWDTYSYPTEELQCITGGEYFVMTREGAETDKTILWLEGGGACWPDREDCRKAAIFYDWFEDQGLAAADQANPVRSWNFVYVPYCDGSNHMGDNAADYDGDGEPDHYHWGLKMTSAAIRLMKEQFPASRKILIAGCSAGGAGTMGAAPVVRLQFPAASLYVLNVSGLALLDPAHPGLLRMIKETWNIGQFVPADCPACNEHMINFYSWLLQYDSGLRVGVFSSYYDAVISSAWGVSPEDFRSLIIHTTDPIRDDHPDTFQRFFIDGAEHCIGDYSYRVKGISLWEWVGYLVNDDQRWVDTLE